MTDFAAILDLHRKRYSLMQPQDYGKLAFQSEFGPEHLVRSGDPQISQTLLEEWTSAEGGASRPPEPIGNGLCRFHLAGPADASAASLLALLFARTAQEHHGTPSGLKARLSAVKALQIPGVDAWLESYSAQGCPAVHHSEEFRRAYQPHYRVIRQDYADWFPALLAIQKLIERAQPAIVAIDGRCGSGKSTLARLIAQLFPCNVFHMDDFYLPLPRRVKTWEHTPCANMDLPRFLKEDLLPARNGHAVSYHVFSCQHKDYLPAVEIPFSPLTLVEGSYSHHPSLAPQYDLRIFLTCEQAEQARRLQAREGDYFPQFQQRWIPLEDGYFRQYEIESNADLILNTTDFYKGDLQ